MIAEKGSYGSNSGGGSSKAVVWLLALLCALVAANTATQIIVALELKNTAESSSTGLESLTEQAKATATTEVLAPAISTNIASLFSSLNRRRLQTFEETQSEDNKGTEALINFGVNLVTQMVFLQDDGIMEELTDLINVIDLGKLARALLEVNPAIDRVVQKLFGEGEESEVTSVFGFAAPFLSAVASMKEPLNKPRDGAILAPVVEKVLDFAVKSISPQAIKTLAKTAVTLGRNALEVLESDVTWTTSVKEDPLYINFFIDYSETCEKVNSTCFDGYYSDRYEPVPINSNSCEYTCTSFFREETLEDIREVIDLIEECEKLI